MAENKTKPTAASVDAFLDAVPDPQRREDARAVRALMERLSGEPATMWGPGIVGFGRYRYRYDSGREGEFVRIGFSPRAKELVLYLVDGFKGSRRRLTRAQDRAVCRLQKLLTRPATGDCLPALGYP